MVLEREPTEYEDVETETPGLFRRFFHIIVRNRHRHRASTNCYVYLEKATNLDTLTDILLPTFELKWEGYRLFYVNIAPNQFRRFDAFCVPHDFPTRLGFSRMFSDWSGIIPRIEGAGQYELSYLVLSSNFPPARGSFILNLCSRARRDYVGLAQHNVLDVTLFEAAFWGGCRDRNGRVSTGASHLRLVWRAVEVWSRARVVPSGWAALPKADGP